LNENFRRLVPTSNGSPVKNSERAHREKCSQIAAVALYLITGIACSRVPLLNYLGYESSFVVALLASIVTGVTIIAAMQRSVRSPNPPEWSVERVSGLFRKQLFTNLVLLVIPLAILSANALLVKNCAWWEGLGFYLLLPVVSVWFSAALGLFCAVHYRRARLAFFSVIIVSLLYVLFLGYATPAIFSYNFFYGYFPGLSYDEVLGISLPLILFRLLTVGLGGVLFWLALLLVRSSTPDDTCVTKGKALLATLISRRWRVAGACVAAALLLLFVFRCECGWESTAAYIQSQLGERYDTPHVTVYYSSAVLSPVAIRRIGGEHEFRLAQLVREFGAGSTPHVESYVYPTAAVKQRLMGAGNTNIAKPWSGQVHCTLQSLEPTLKHELAHVVAAPFGWPIIRASLRTGLVEGLATAQDGTWGNRTLHQYAAAMRKFGPMPDMPALMSFTGFTAQNTALSYVAAGSLCRYLIDAYGMKPLLAVYGGTDFAEAFGRPLPDLVAEWKRFLGRMRVEDRERDVLESFFRQPPIFRKTCARVIAGRNDAARAALARRDYAGARDLYRASFQEAGGYESLGGLLATMVRLREYEAAVRLCDSTIAGSDHPAQYLPLFLWYGDARWALGDTAGARQLYQRLRDADLADHLVEGAAVRLLALDGSLHRNDVLAFFLSDAPDSARIMMLDSLARLVPKEAPLLRYLAGRTMARKGEPASAVAVLQSVDLTALSLPLEHLRRKTVGGQYYLLNNLEAARTTFWLSLNGLTSEAATIEAREWVTRCDWMKRHGY
jgi:hypothetical protein